jgi:chemotaxis protein methyltransferase CheR
VSLPAAIVAQVGRRLAEHAGLELPAWVLEARVAGRMRALGVDADGYLGLVNAPHGRGELGALVEAVRVGETRFFRHRSQVQALIDVVVPAWRARRGHRFRAWSAGCATGEEPYTLALVLCAMAPHPGAVSILATDVSDEALAVARRGVYPAAVMAHVPREWRGGLVERGGEVRVRPEIARRVSFERHNLADDAAPRGFELVWCRNVLIYFGEGARRRAIARLVAAAEPGGFVFVGYAEFLRGVAGLEAVRGEDCTIYRRREEGEEEEEEAGEAERPVAAAVEATRTSRGAGAGTGTGTRTKASAGTVNVGGERLVVRGVCDDPAKLGGELARALARPGLERLTVELDGAEFLAEEIAPVLRRARAAAEAAGVRVAFAAARPGTRRWLARHGLAGGAA